MSNKQAPNPGPVGACAIWKCTENQACTGVKNWWDCRVCGLKWHPPPISVHTAAITNADESAGGGGRRGRDAAAELLLLQFNCAVIIKVVCMLMTVCYVHLLFHNRVALRLWLRATTTINDSCNYK